MDRNWGKRHPLGGVHPVSPDRYPVDLGTLSDELPWGEHSQARVRVDGVVVLEPSGEKAEDGQRIGE